MSDEEILNHMFNTSSSTVKDEIICIVDRSGSMQRIKTDAEGGLNAFIEEQKKVTNGANLTLVEFDDRIDTIYDRVDIKSADPYHLEPRGGTSLLDAIGFTLTRFEDNTSGKKIVVIVTDGEENSSREYNRDSIFKMITERKEQNWEFMFLAANQDAIAVGGSYGIDAGATVSFAYSDKGIEQGYAAAATYATSLRTKSKVDAVADMEFMKSNLSDIS